MVFEEPKVELIEIDMNNVIATSCTSSANATPSMQGCSSGSAHEESCADELHDWVD